MTSFSLSDARLQADPRRVVHETIDGEVVLIQLETGTYYSLTGSGADVWALLAGGRTADEAVAVLAERFPAAAASMRQTVLELARRLVEEGLLEEVAEASPPPPEPVPGGEFREPVLEKYTDMQDFLLVDPVHEVGDAGWPHLSAGG